MPLLLLLLAALPLAAQPTVGSVQIFGLRKLPIEKIQKALAVKPGDPLPPSKGAVEERLESIDGVVRARLEAWCCEQGKPVLYVGIEERGVLGRNLLPYPQNEELALPDEITAAYADFSSALARATAAGDLKEDLSPGHSLMENLPARIAQQRFTGLAELHLDSLRRVLREAASPDQRAVAAYVLGYAPDKASVIAGLQSALQDPDGSVRLNAARALKAIAYVALRHPSSGLKVPATWFVEMLNSVELSDRLEAVRTLLLYAGAGDESALASIRERALPALFEMARWQYLPHALPAYLLLGRVYGVSDDALEKAWAAGDREKALHDMEKPPRRK
jgi:hypothetical protein